MSSKISFSFVFFTFHTAVMNIQVFLATLFIVHSFAYPVEYCEDKTWLKFGDHCYEFQTSYGEARVSFYEAEEKCRLKGAHLVSIHSEEENSFISYMMRNKYYAGRQWIGLNTLQGEKNYQWTDGSSVGYMKLVNTTQYKKEKCFVYYPSESGWRSEHCNLHHLPLCKKPVNVIGTTLSPPTTVEPEGNCPSDWLQHGKKCYKYFGAVEEDRKKFRDAKQACIALGDEHDLVSIHSMKEQAFLIQNLAFWKNSTWIGFSYVESDEIGHDILFGWTDNSRVDFTYWAPGRPTSGTWKNCATLSYEGVNKGEWMDEYCDIVKRGYICQRPVVPNQPPPTAEPTTCDDGYIGYRNSCYKYYTTPKTWLNAMVFCQKNGGGHLVSIIDIFEQAFLFNNVHGESNMIWTSLNTIQRKKVFHWNDGVEPFYFSMWADGQPTFTEDTSHVACVAMASSNNLKWNVTKCDRELPFVCEISHRDQHPHIPDVEGKCPDSNLTLIDIGDEYCYHIGEGKNDRLQWGPLFRFCNSKGMEMVTWNSYHRSQLLMTYVWTKPYDFWLGLIQSDSGSFKWIDNSPMKFSNWGTKEPSRMFDDAKCAVFSTRDSKWYARSCSSWNGSLCRVKKVT